MAHKGQAGKHEDLQGSAAGLLSTCVSVSLVFLWDSSLWESDMCLFEQTLLSAQNSLLVGCLVQPLGGRGALLCLIGFCLFVCFLSCLVVVS